LPAAVDQAVKSSVCACLRERSKDRLPRMEARDAAPAGRASSARAPPPVSKAKAKARGRPKAGARPKIDMDEEIEKANKLAEMSRKMMNAAKSIQKNNRRLKNRLVRKAGKLSPEDLDRIACLKRCGLFAEPDHDEDGEEEDGDDAAPGDNAGVTPIVKKAKVAVAVPKIAGSERIFNTFCEDMRLENASSGSSSSSVAAGRSITAQCMQPRGKRLFPMATAPLSPDSVITPQPSEIDQNE
jgi:hypothetical protein